MNYYNYLQKILVFFILLFALSSFAIAEDEKINAVADQLQIIIKDLNTLEKAVYKTSDITKSVNSISSNGLNEEILTRHLLKLNEIEEQFRLLTNRFEEVNFKLDKISNRVTKIQSDTQMRFLDLESGKITDKAKLNKTEEKNQIKEKEQVSLPGTDKPQDLGAAPGYSLNPNETMQATQSVETKASDLHLSSGSIPMVRIDGVMQTLQLPAMTNEDMSKISQEVLNNNQSKILTKQLEIDFSYELENFGRFRVNFFNQINGLAAAFRIIPSSILSSEELSIPPIINQLAFLDKGLVLLTGPTGSGKSTTLAAMINHINENKNKHIITVEDPVEYYHSSIKSLINQRELGHSTHSFANALKSALISRS